MFWWVIDQLLEARRRLGLAMDMREENLRLRSERDIAQKRLRDLELETDAQRYVELERRRRG